MDIDTKLSCLLHFVIGKKECGIWSLSEKKKEVDHQGVLRVTTIENHKLIYGNLFMLFPFKDSGLHTKSKSWNMDQTKALKLLVSGS